MADARRAAFVREYVYGAEPGNAAAAYKAAGYSPRGADGHASRLVGNGSIAAQIAGETAKRDAAIKSRGIARKEERLARYNDLADRIGIVLQERGDDPALRRALGGRSGFVTRTWKTVPNADPAKPPMVVTEEKFDGALWTAFLALLKQAAIEAGDWDEKRTVKIDAPALQQRARKLANDLGLDEAEAVAMAQDILRGVA